MSKAVITASAIRFWQSSLTALSYTEYMLVCKAKGLFWNSSETLEDGSAVNAEETLEDNHAQA